MNLFNIVHKYYKLDTLIIVLLTIILAAGLIYPFKSLATNLFKYSTSTSTSSAAARMSSMAQKSHPSIILTPKSNKYTAAMIIIHGLGDSGYGWQPVAEELQQDYPYIKFILPHAPNQAVTLNGGMKMPSWHDIKNLSKIDSEDYVGIVESKTIIKGLIDEELKLDQIKSDRIVVAGFSQGAAMAVVSGFEFSQKLAGIVALSGYLPFNGDFGTAIHESNKSTPAFVGHGTADMVVPPKAGEKLAESLKAAKIPVTYKTYRGLQHSTSEEEIEDLKEFVGKVLPKV